MNDIKISIELRIEANSESAARRYAAKHGINIGDAKWYPNRESKGGGKFYASTNTPFLGTVQTRQTSAGICGCSDMANTFCANPVHKILYCGAPLCE